MLRLDEDRRFEREERRRLFEDSEGDSLDGFIVTGSEEEEEEEEEEEVGEGRVKKKKKKKEGKISPVGAALHCASTKHHQTSTNYINFMNKIFVVCLNVLLI